MFKSFSEILKQFTTSQRIFALILLLVFSSGSYIATSYFKTDDCSSLIKENLALQEDFVKISQIIRKYEMSKHIAGESYVRMDTINNKSNLIEIIFDENILDSVLKISDTHIPK